MLCAKNIADCFNISLYDMHVELKCIPFVESEPPDALNFGLCAGHLMTSPCITLPLTPTVAHVLALLRDPRSLPGPSPASFLLPLHRQSAMRIPCVSIVYAHVSDLCV